jgi:hypothetical protein
MPIRTFTITPTPGQYSVSDIADVFTAAIDSNLYFVFNSSTYLIRLEWAGAYGCSERSGATDTSIILNAYVITMTHVASLRYFHANT